VVFTTASAMLNTLAAEDSTSGLERRRPVVVATNTTRHPAAPHPVSATP